MRRFLTLAVCAALASTGTACLKTRAQLRSDDDDDHTGPGKPVPAKVEDVQAPPTPYVLDEIKLTLTKLEGRIEDLERQQREAQASKNDDTKDQLKRLETRIS